MTEDTHRHTLTQRLRRAARFPKAALARMRVRRWMTRKDGRAGRSPMMLTFEPTRRCNLRCSMCYIDESKRRQKVDELTVEAFKTFLHGVRIRSVNLVGGEPFMRRDLFDLIDVLRDRRIMVGSLTTNGTLIDRDAATRIASLVAERALESVTMSLDGREALHNEIRGSEKAFSRLAEGVALLKAALAEAGLDHRRYLKIITTVSETNFNTFPEVVPILAEWDLGVLQINHLTFATPAERDRSARALGVDSEEIDTYVLDLAASPLDAEAIRDGLVEVGRRARENGIELTGRPFLNPATALEYYTEDFRPDLACPCPWGQARVGATGEMSFCFLIRTPVGQTRDAGLTGAWNSDRYRQLRGRFAKTGCLEVCKRCCKAGILENA